MPCYLGITLPTRRHIPEDSTLHSHCLENLKLSQKWTQFTGWFL